MVVLPASSIHIGALTSTEATILMYRGPSHCAIEKILTTYGTSKPMDMPGAYCRARAETMCVKEISGRLLQNGTRTDIRTEGNGDWYVCTAGQTR